MWRLTERPCSICPCFNYRKNDPVAPPLGTSANVVRLNPELNASRAEVFAALRAENIGVNVHYIPIPWMTHYANLGYVRGQWPVAETEYERILSLPMFPDMTDRDVGDVVEAVNKIWKAYRR